MSKNSQKVINWRNRTKDRIIQSFGGQCGQCGYNKSRNALDLHHLDPSQKEFGIGRIRANPKSWEKIVSELRKCVLLCANCHREFHDDLFVISDTMPRFNEEFADYKKLQAEDRRNKCYNNCPVCGKEKFHLQKTCSYVCEAAISGKYEWDKFNLKKLYFDDNLNLTQISKLVGCSDNAVKKRMIKLNLISRKTKQENYRIIPV